MTSKTKEKVYKEHGVHWWLATLGMRPALDIPSDHLLEKTDTSLTASISYGSVSGNIK